MDFGLAGKTALVTGASKGIGLAVARTLAAEGARVVLVARSRELLAQAVDGIERAGGAAVAIPGDVSKMEDVERVVGETRERLGDPSVLVANAGGPPAGQPTDLDESAWAKAVDLTLMSSVRLGMAVLPAMRAAGWGRLVNITSLSVKEPILNLTLSNALRSGVTAWAKTLAEEVAGDGVTVNNVQPGWTATERIEELLPTEEAKRALLQRIPAGRMGRPEEIAAAVAFLASEQAGYVTGQSLLVDGGIIRGM